MRKILQTILDWEFWLVLALTGASFIFTQALWLAALLPFGFWLVRRWATGSWTAHSAIGLPVLGMVLLLPFNYWISPVRVDSLVQILRLLNGIGLLYATVNWAHSRERLITLTNLLVGIGVGLAAFAPVSVVWGARIKLPFISPELYERFGVLVTDAVNTNVMAGMLILFIPLAAGLLFYAWEQQGTVQRGYLIGAGLAMLAVLILTQSRSALIALTASLLVVVLLRWSRAGLVLVLSLAGVLVVALLTGIGAFNSAITNFIVDAGLSDRLELWSRGLMVLGDVPFTGLGMGGFAQSADLLYPFFIGAPEEISHVHNLYLQIALDLGAPGLVLWLATFCLCGYTAVRVMRRGQKSRLPLATGLGAGQLGSLVALGIHGLFDAVTWGMVRPAPLVWLIWAAGMAATNLYLRKKRSGDQV